MASAIAAPATSAMGGLLPLYWSLASLSDEERLSSTSKLVTNLVTQQRSLQQSEASTSARTLADYDGMIQEAAAVLPGVGKDSDATKAMATDADDLEASRMRDAEATKGDAPKFLTRATPAEVAAADRFLDEATTADVSYAVRRLVKGLASPRENARMGFAVALTELLSKIDDIPCGVVLVLLLRHTEIKGKLKGHEERDLLFARLFGVEALIASGLALRDSASRKHDFQRAIEVLLSLVQKKGWMAESCTWVALQALRALKAAQSLEWRKEAKEWLEERLLQGKGLTPEKLAILIEVQGNSQKPLSARFSGLKGPQLFSSVNLPVIARVLKNAGPREDEDEDDGRSGVGGAAGTPKDATGSYQAQLHFVWDSILDRYLDPAGKELKGAAPFSDFFRHAVDESLFAPTSSAERKAWGFQVLNKALPRVPAAEVPLLFTQNFMRSWINHLASKERLLHKAALKTVETVQSVVRDHPKTGFALVTQLLGPHGNRNFDRITGTKTVESILASMRADGVQEYVGFLVRTACDDATDEAPESEANQGAGGTAHTTAAAATPRRKWALDQMLALVRNVSIPKQDSWVMEVLAFLCAHGFFALAKPAQKISASLSRLPKPAYAPELRQVCRPRFLSCLAELSEQMTQLSDAEGSRARRPQGVDSSGRPWLARAHDDLLVRFESEPKLFRPVSDQRAQQEQLRIARKLVASLREKAQVASRPDEKSCITAVENLIHAAIFVAYEGDEENDDLLEPLCDCAKALIVADEAADADDDDEPGPLELFVDCLVGFLERSSAFLRSSANHAFTAFAHRMTKKSLRHLVDQLGVNDDSEEDGSEADGSDGGGDGAEGAQPRDEDDDSETSATSMSGDIDFDDEQEEGQVDPVLRAAIEAAFKTSGVADSGSESDDDDDAASDAESSESEVLGDEDMMQLDEKLADIFRERVGARKRDAEARREAIAFQNKILDLVELYAKREASNALVPATLVAPLLRLALETEQQGDSAQIAQRAGNVLRSLAKAKEHPSGVPLDDVISPLQQAHEAARKVPQSQAQAIATAVNGYLTKCCLTRGAAADASSASLPTDKTDATRLLAVYTETLDDFLHRKASAVKPAFFLDALLRCPAVGWALRRDFARGCDVGTGAKKRFRQLQALQMLQSSLTQAVQSPALAQEILDFMPEVCRLVGEVVVAASEGQGEDDAAKYTSANLKEYLKFALQCVRISKRAAAADPASRDDIEAAVRTAWPPEKLRGMADRLASSQRFSASAGLQQLLRQMTALVEPGPPAAKPTKKQKRKDDVEGVDTVKDRGAEKVAAKRSKGGQGEEADSQAKVAANGKKPQATSSQASKAGVEPMKKKKKVARTEAKPKRA